MRSDTIKQIIICIIIVVTTGVVAFLAKDYFFTSNKAINNNTAIKDKYEYNEYKLVNVTNEVIVQRYLMDFKDKMLTSTMEAYNLLDDDTKEKYESYDDFKMYVDNNKEKIKESYAVKFNIQTKGNSTNYIVIDQYNNKYTFMSKAVLIYSVNLELSNENSSFFE